MGEGRGARRSISVGDPTWSYAGVRKQANRARHALGARGIGFDDRVLMLLFDGIAVVECWFGTLKSGATFCMANPLGTADDLDYLLGYTRCRAVVADESTMERLAPLMDKHPHCRVRLVVGAENAEPG